MIVIVSVVFSCTMLNLKMCICVSHWWTLFVMWMTSWTNQSKGILVKNIFNLASRVPLYWHHHGRWLLDDHQSSRPDKNTNHRWVMICWCLSKGWVEEILKIDPTWLFRLHRIEVTSFLWGLDVHAIAIFPGGSSNEAFSGSIRWYHMCPWQKAWQCDPASFWLRRTQEWPATWAATWAPSKVKHSEATTQ